MTPTENLCLSAGCLGLCCRDKFFWMNQESWVHFKQGLLNDKIWETTWQRLVAISQIGIAQLKRHNNYDGIVFGVYSKKPLTWEQITTDPDTSYLVLLLGICPHLKDSNCTIYERRPNACANFQMGEENCRNIQKTYMALQK